MKRFLLTVTMMSLVMTIPLVASAEAGFRKDSGKHSSHQQYQDTRKHKQESHHPGKKFKHREYRKVRHHHDRHHVGRRYGHTYYREPVRTRIVEHRTTTAVIPLPGVVIGLPSVAVRIGW